MKRQLILSVFLLLFTVDGYSIYFKHIGIQEGLSQVSVLSICQDQLGRMWFGTEEGISIYDGVYIKTYKSGEYSGEKTDVAGNSIRYIAEAGNGNIFFESANALIRYDIYSQHFTQIRESSVYSVCSDNGIVRVGIADSIYRWDAEKEELQLEFHLNNSNLRITYIKVDAYGNYWLGTNNGLYLCPQGNMPECILPHEDVFAVFEDSKHNLWISLRMNGLYKRDLQGKMTYYRHDTHKQHSLSDNQVRGVAEDNFGTIWIGTFFGLNKYNPSNDSFEVYSRTPLPGSLSHSSVFPVYKDLQGTMWIGTYYGGVNYFNPETDLFSVYTDDTRRDDCLSYNFVGHMTEDKDHNLWICTEGGGLNFFDRRTKKFTYFQPDQNRNSIAHNNLKDIAYSEKHRKLYIGTHTGGLSIYDMKTGRFRNPYFDNPAYKTMAGDRIIQMDIWNDYLVFTTPKGVFKMDLNTETFTPLLQKKEMPGNGVFVIDSKDFLWQSERNVIYKTDLNNPEKEIRYTYGENWSSPSIVLRMLEDHKGRIFFGTRGSGLFCYDEENDRFRNYTTENSFIASNYCYDLALSSLGHLIVLGDKGLTFFDQDRNSFRVVEQGTALPLAGINTGCGILVCENGEIFVGGINGMVSFFEQQLFNSAKEYKLYFSGLYINNEEVSPSDHTGVLVRALPYTEKIELAHHQNNLIFTFTSNNYVNTLKKTTYEYMLEGFDDKWIQSNDNNIYYTNLNPGTYTLIVREKLYDSTIMQPQTIRMNIFIRTPWYRTHLAYLLYLVLLTSLLYSFFRFKKSQLLLQNSLALERKEKEAIAELNQAKLQFFSNISHEFRTPLTLIISQMELLLQSGSLAPGIYSKLLKVYKNTFHMRKLISELLDFRKLEQGQLKLKVYEQNIVPFLKEIFLSFYEYASGRSITYRFSSEKEHIPCWFDPKQMGKVFYNLLSNAFKYTSQGATVEMMIEADEQEVRIKVIDNGIGIDKKDIDRIFDRFYQAQSGVNNPIGTAPSTGIGLSICKNIVDLHHGSIKVESTPGYGSIFIVRLLKGNTHFREEELATAMTENREEILKELSVSLYNEEKTDLWVEEEVQEKEEKVSRKVLLVEDNEELLQILSSLFMPFFRVITARNGKEGLNKARKEQPDIIVSDIMMPEMSGTEMCMKIKNDIDLCHIPVVLLTALTSVEQNIEGLQRGADDYINKPFNAKVLLSRCNNLLRNRLILQKKFSRQQDFDTQSLASNPIDQEFLDMVNTIIEKNIDNLNFDMNMLARELGLSRSSLYAKFKALTGMTPNEFVLNYKLKSAAAMLIRHPEWQIADISDRLGFGSPRYFSRCFKTLFEVSPAEYRKSASKK